jgi:putative ABC transport system ATP-binding protein
MIEVQQLRHRYDARHELHLPHWQVARGEHQLILGPSGSGKTTLLHLLAGLLRPSAGRIHIAGQPLDELRTDQLDAFRAHPIGIVFQRPHLLSHLNVMDNLLLAQYLAELPQDRRRVRDVLGQLEMAELGDYRPYQLSQGQLQRVTLARAVLNRPALLLADEPSASLDDRHCEQVLTLLKQQAQECHATLLIATHDQRVRSHFSHCLQLGEGV